MATTRYRTNKKPPVSEMFNFEQDSYLERTSRPLYAIFFLLPFILFYEIGTFYFNTDVLNSSTDMLEQYQIRVFAFIWLKDFLALLGFSSRLAWITAPLTVIIILLSLHITSRKKWSLWLPDFWIMAIECIILAIPLIVLCLFMVNTNATTQNTNAAKIISPTAQQHPLQICAAQDPNQTSTTASTDLTENSIIASIVTSIGAGIYEELLFRLILIILLMIVFQNILQMTHKHSILIAIIISAILFSAHHHIDFLTGNWIEQFDTTKFIFRTLAGVYFAILYSVRGFGITAGTHAFYNIITIFINIFFASN